MTALFLGNSYTYPQSTKCPRNYTQKGLFRGLHFEIKPAPAQATSSLSFVYRGVSC